MNLPIINPADEEDAVIGLTPDDVKEYRDLFLETKGRPLALSHSELATVVEYQDGELNEGEWLALLTRAEDEAAKLRTAGGSSRRARVLEYVAAFDADKQLGENLGIFAEAKRVGNQKPLEVMFDLRRAYNQDTVLVSWNNAKNADVIGEWPVPGSPFKHPVTGKDMPCDNPDRYPTTRDGKKVDGSFYADLFDASQRGRTLAAEIKAAEAEAAKQTQGENAEDLKAEKSLPSSSRTAQISAIKKAVKLHLTFHSLSQYPGIIVKVRLVLNDQGKKVLSRSTYPITVYEKDDTTHARAFSVGTFTNLDPDAALKDKKETNRYQALLNTLDRVVVGAVPAGTVPIITIATFRNNMSEMVAFFQKPEHQAEVFRQLKALKDDENEDLVRLIGDLHNALIAPYGAIKRRYDQLIEAEDEKAKVA